MNCLEILSVPFLVVAQVIGALRLGTNAQDLVLLLDSVLALAVFVVRENIADLAAHQINLVLHASVVDRIAERFDIDIMEYHRRGLGIGFHEVLQVSTNRGSGR